MVVITVVSKIPHSGCRAPDVTVDHLNLRGEVCSPARQPRASILYSLVPDRPPGLR